MSAKRLLFCQGEGIGNIIQCIPVIRTLKEVLGYNVDFWHAHGSYNIPESLFPYVDNWFVGKNKGKVNNINPSKYCGRVSALRCGQPFDRKGAPKISLLTKENTLKVYRSEVDTYMDIARQLGVEEEDILWHGVCNYKKVDEVYDIVIHNGYNRMGAANWKVKSYLYYEEVVRLLINKGFKICSVGMKKEYIKGTIDKTGLSLLHGLGLIKNSKLFLGNDSGLYHCANALEVKNIVIFTATSIEKNYDKRFHKYSKLIYRKDLECRPCQAGQKWRKECTDWKCRNIAPEVIVDGIEELIG